MVSISRFATKQSLSKAKPPPRTPMTSTKKGNARVGKPAGSRLAYDATKALRPPRNKIMAEHLKPRIQAKGNWAHKVLV